MTTASRVVPESQPATRAPRRSRPLVIMAAVIGLMMVAAACSSKGYGTSSSSTSTTKASGSASPYGAGAASSTTTVASGSKNALSIATTSLGPVVVDSSGRTLYLYEKDTGSTPTCTGPCAKAWPAATVSGTPSSSADITATVTVATAADGSTQLVLNGHPLYRYAADTAPGDVNGQNVGGVWFAVKADGQKAG